MNPGGHGYADPRMSSPLHNQYRSRLNRPSCVLEGEPVPNRRRNRKLQVLGVPGNRACRT